MPGASVKWHPIRWLAYLVGAMTCYAVLRSIGSLLKQVQQSGSDLFGGMETLGSGLLPMAAVQRTQSLLRVWHESFVTTPAVRETILTTSVIYTVADVVLIFCYWRLLVGLYRWLSALPTRETALGARWALFQRLAQSPKAVWIPALAALADLTENGIRLRLIWNAFRSDDGAGSTWLVCASWGATTAKFALLILSVVVLLLLIRDSGTAHGRWRTLGWALWRLRVPVGATLIFVALVLGDPTGQAADLVRRWIDSWANALIGLAAILGAGLLGFTVWLITRRVVLSDQDMAGAVRRRQELGMTVLWLLVGIVTAAVAIWALDWSVDRNGLLILSVALLITLAAMFLPFRRADGGEGGAAAGPEPRTSDWRAILLVATIAAWIVAWLADWRELRAPATVASIVLVLELAAFVGAGGARTWLAGLRKVFRRPDPAEPPAEPGYPAARAKAAHTQRMSDVRKPDLAKYRMVRRIARLVAIAAPVALLITAAGALAPVPLVLHLSRTDETLRFSVAVIVAVGMLAAPVAVAIGGYAALRALDGPEPRSETAAGPNALEGVYQVFVPIIVLGAAVGLIGGAAHWPAIGPLSIVAAFLATAIIVLGEAQLRSETHGAPRSFLLAGFTRVPPVTLLVLTSLIAGFAFSDGTGHAVYKSGRAPAQGIDLGSAFRDWAAHNCADAAHRNSSVPLVVVSAPGGGLRAAYWTASTLTDLFGPTAAPGTTCPGAAPSDRVFAVGGASGGSLGELAWIAGLDPDRPRDAHWYDQQLAAPDFLSDPMAWLLTVDLARSYLGFHGQDRARRLENRWSQHIPGLSDDFFAGSWGLGGHRPIPLLTGTQVETGCRLNVSGVRVTHAGLHERETSCTTVHDGVGQEDAPAVSDLLDFLCGPVRGSGETSLSRSTAALLSARFPWVSPSGQLDRCATPEDNGDFDATRVSIVDGGYADNSGMGLLLDAWPRLERMIAQHNAAGDKARIVPVFLEVDNHYAAVAAPSTPDHTAETLVPPLTRNRPDQLDDISMRARTAAIFAGPVPGTDNHCTVGPAGRYLRVSPRISPGLPAPLAWTLSRAATEDLRSQRGKALAAPGPAALSGWAAGRRTPTGC